MVKMAMAMRRGATLDITGMLQSSLRDVGEFVLIIRGINSTATIEISLRD
jgi:hypothetical protein